MKKRIIQTAISLTALVASFLPQKAEAASCAISCVFGSCFAEGETVSASASGGFFRSAKPPNGLQGRVG